MQAAIANSIKDAFVQHRSDYGVSITIDSEVVTAIVSESQFARELMEGGFADEGDIEIKVLLSDLAQIPSLGKPVVFRSRNFRVSRVGTQPGAFVGEISCRPSKR
jgi:hypothetical protein|tara:strand:+ start:1722 stop:2036 length:315 start_codon:yes stop_codon:yes gene_type:complete